MVQVALATLGTALGKLGQKIRTKVFGGKRHQKKDVGDELNQRLCTRFCFPAGTLVDTAEGLRPIESVQEGELVWGRDEQSGHWDLHQVVETYQREYSGPVVTLQTGEETIVVTGGHPFWVESGEHLTERPDVVGLRNDPEAEGVRGRWVSARDLRVGDTLVRRGGDTAAIESVSTHPETLTVYNFQVHGVQSYTITESRIWVHNNSEKCDGDDTSKGKAGGPNPGHTPGRGHRRKSDPQKTKRFQKKARQKKAAAQQAYEDALAVWENMSEAARKLRPELNPENFKP